MTATLIAVSTSEKPISIDEITKAMSQVNLKFSKILNLKEKNNQINKENKTLQEKKDKQKIKWTGQLSLQGSKHIIWDMISAEITKF